ncbi:cell surface protein [Enterococcus saigonensis]|uniref:Cell surface protein n=1 Tax=Enterococcus saigonensis TaxID=1805431 RepID=A0A679IKM2_9ENTE|nr:WxL domain-containing protein [Enterococcus saigonensis]BCA85211.1 cell surface protein [Enterococcus saigonensis]
MKKKILASLTFSTLILSVATPTVFAADNTLVTNEADVTLQPGSGTNVKPVVDPTGDTDETPETGATGALTIPFASSISFGSQEIQPNDTTYYAQNQRPFVQVNDTRGDMKGWTLSVSVSEFKGAKNQKPLKGAQLSFMNGKVVTQKNTSTPPTISSERIDLNQSFQPVMVAEKGQGAGAWATLFEGKKGHNEKVKLFVPQAGVEAQAYTASLTWGLTDAPM